MQDIQQNAINLYLNNMNFLKQHSPALHEKLEMFDNGVSYGLIEERFQLELRDNEYFDILDIKNNSWIYDRNSKIYSEDIAKNTDLDLTKNSFKTFHEYHYEDGVAEKVANAGILSDSLFGTAPIIDYINRNTPKDRISKQIFCYMIFGVGLGLHIPLIQKMVNAKLYCIIEPQLEIFRLSLFTVSYEEIAKKAQIIFFVALDKETFTSKFREFHDKAYLYNQYIKFFLFSKSSEFYFEGVQSMLVSQSHYMFSYDRELKSLMKTANYTTNEYSFIKVNERFPSKFANNAPILILAGGPSLKKNLEFVKKNQDRFLIISLYSLSNFLRENGIEPDIITNYDEQYELYLEIFNKIDNKQYFDNKVLLFGSHVSERLVELLPKDNVYFFNALYSLRKDIGILTGPSIGEMSYALSLIFAPEKVYLLGLDLALDPLSGKSHFDGYEEKAQFDVNRESSLEKFSFRKNVMKIKGNLRDIVETTAIFNISRKQLDIFTKLYNPDKKVEIFNLSDGAYFEDVKPLNTEEIDLNNFPILDKEILHFQIKESLNKISSNKLNEEDVEYLKSKLNDAKVLKNKFNEWLSTKHSSSEKFLMVLEELNDEVFRNASYKCKDLNKILWNYFRYTFPYIIYFFNLRSIENPKAHMKKIIKNLLIKINNIIDIYIELLEKNIDKR